MRPISCLLASVMLAATVPCVIDSSRFGTYLTQLGIAHPSFRRTPLSEEQA